MSDGSDVLEEDVDDREPGGLRVLQADHRLGPLLVLKLKVLITIRFFVARHNLSTIFVVLNFGHHC